MGQEKRRLIVGPEAETELLAEASWYDEKLPGLGQDFFTSVEGAFRLVQRFPGLGSPAPEVPAKANVRRIRVEGFPYWVVYRELRTAIHVIAVAHSRRRPGYWRDR